MKTVVNLYHVLILLTNYESVKQKNKAKKKDYLVSSVRDPASNSTAKTLGINLEERGQNTNIRHPNEICDLISQNNIFADPDSRNSNNRDGFRKRIDKGVRST